KGKRTRGIVILDFVKNFLDSKPYEMKDAYKSYINEIKRIQKSGMREIEIQIGSMLSAIKSANEKIKNIEENLAVEKDIVVKEIQKKHLEVAKEELAESRKQLKDLKAKKHLRKLDAKDYEEFLQTFKDIRIELDNVQDPIRLSQIIEKIFL